jgi:hypothetical protein
VQGKNRKVSKYKSFKNRKVQKIEMFTNRSVSKVVGSGDKNRQDELFDRTAGYLEHLNMRRDFD